MFECRWILALPAVFACSAPPTSVAGVMSAELIGGLVAWSPELDHTGALVRVDADSGKNEIVCSATLISTEAAVTAEHCVRLLAAFQRLGQLVAWAGGPDVNNPAHFSLVVGVEHAEGTEQPGAAGFGYDVAVVHLDEPIDVAPAVVRPFDSAAIQGSMVTLGYGMPAAWAAPDGMRRIGRETVSALRGRLYEAIYGSFDAYAERQLANAGASDRLGVTVSTPDEGSLRAVYDSTLLIPEHEVVTRTLGQNTRGCRGDSGGPLMRVSEAGDWETYGVLSGGPSSSRAECDFGQVYATFGARTFPLVSGARGWTDPCGSTSTVGTCSGSVLSRCEVDLVAGARRLVSEDCQRSGQRCVTSVVGVQCGGTE